MENSIKRYWKGLEELRNDESFVKNAHNEFGNAQPTNPEQYKSVVDGIGSDRRDFLKVLGFGMAAVSLAACETPVKKAVPYLNKPNDTFPSIADYYASTYSEGGDYTSILVKTREGRPIKIEGNKMSGISKGGVSARVHASLLNLYDIEKLKGPRKGEADTDWTTLDKEVTAKLADIAAKGGQVRIVSSTILSPSTKAVIANFIAKYPTAQHVTYDANSVAGLLKANADSFGKAVLPSYDFSKAKVIVGINCDFLGSWIAPQEFSRQYAETRKLSSAKDGKRDMSRHFQFETAMSITGSNADYRATVKPSQEGAVVAAIYNKLSGKGASSLGEATDKMIAKAANELAANKGASLVVSGSNDPAVQTVVNAINAILGSYGSTIGMNATNYRQGSDVAMNGFIDEAKAGKVSAVIFYAANPVYDHPRAAELKDTIGKMALSVSFADRADETSSLCGYIAPAPHYLECWDDAEPKAGHYSLTQPAISLIFKTRQAQSSLLKWAGANDDYHAFLKNNWSSNIAPNSNFESFWTKTLHDGVYEPGAGSTSGASFSGNADAAASSISKTDSKGIEVILYEKVGMGTGAMANNPWLQEFPEPVTKACWDNYASVSQATAKELGVAQDDVVKVEVNGKSVELPVMVQPGQADGTVAIAIGYGREKAGKSGNGVGANAYPLARFTNGYLNFNAGAGTVTKTGETHKIAQTQTHETVMGRRAVVQEARLPEYKKSTNAGRYFPHVVTSEGNKKPTDITLWNGYEKPNHNWGMVIDLNSCTGCGACVVSCQAENNVPVVGRQEVINRREMHWIRIDRYYSTDADLENQTPSGYKAMEIASANPEVVFQPLMCQHCSNAPCETVCPVLATTHSTEGLNQMAYNRCVGTRYCANNCPYKVRRFNWFKYFDEVDVAGREFNFNFANDLGKMVINPDVTVRSRGVIEKCSMCVQRIQEGKLTAKKERRRPTDGEIVTACAQSCPTNAITFGDMNDPNSSISKVLTVEGEARSFQMLEEINVKPNVSYLTKIRNKDVDAAIAGAKHAAEAHEAHH